MAGGREMHLRSLQPLALHVANSLFLGDYLTSEGQAAQADLDMIADGGFTVLGADPTAHADAEVAIRRRGAGTELAPNA
jgi:biotin synthase